MKKKKIIAFVLSLGVLSSIAFTGCNQNSSQSSSNASVSKSNAPVTLNYYTWSDESTYIPQETKAFEAQYPNIKLNTIVVPGADYDNKMKLLLLGGTTVDVFDVRGIGMLTQYEQGGALLDLSSKIKSSKFNTSAFGPLYKDSVTGGKVYGLPMRSSAWITFYNKTLFDQAGVPYPGQMTWIQFEQLSKEMTKGSGTNKQWGAFLTNFLYNQIALQRGYTLDNTSPAADAALQESLGVFNQMWKVDNSAMGIAEQTATNTSNRAVFETGKVAMEVIGDWRISQLQQDESQGKSSVKWGIAPLPVPDGVTPGTTNAAFTFVSVCKASKFQDQAWTYASFLAGESGAKVMASTVNLPAYHSTDVQNVYTNAAPVSGSQGIFNSLSVQEMTGNSHYGELTTDFTNEAQLYLLGQASLSTAMKDYQSKRSALLGK